MYFNNVKQIWKQQHWLEPEKQPSDQTNNIERAEISEEETLQSSKNTRRMKRKPPVDH